MSACVKFELLEFVFESVYVGLQYDEISLTFTAGSVCLCLCGACGPWSVCEVVVVPYVVSVVVAVTVMHVLLFVLHLCRCEGDSNVGVGSGGWCRWGVGRGLGPGSDGVGWSYVCVRCESGFSV